MQTTRSVHSANMLLTCRLYVQDLRHKLLSATEGTVGWAYEDEKTVDGMTSDTDVLPAQTVLNPVCSPVRFKVLVNGLWQK